MAIDKPDTSRRRFLTIAGASTAAAFFPLQGLVAGTSVEVHNER